MVTEFSTRWEALLSGIHPDSCGSQVLFDPLVEGWAFAGLSPEFQQIMKEKDHSDQERAILLDRLRWIVQKRLSGREQEIMLLYLAGCSQVDIAERLGISRSTVRRSLVESGEKLKKIVGMSDCLERTFRQGDIQVRILPLDSEEDFRFLAEFVKKQTVLQLALGTFADLREVLVVFRQGLPSSSA